MKKKFLILTSSIFLTFLSLNFLYFSCSYSFETASKLESNYIFLIDLNTIICPICLNPIKEVLDDLKMKNPHKVIGIVVCDKSFSQSERNLRIINRQIKGFKTGYSLTFPIYIDLNGNFSCLGGNGVSLIELNNTSKCVMKKEFIPGEPKL